MALEDAIDRLIKSVDALADKIDSMGTTLRVPAESADTKKTAPAADKKTAPAKSKKAEEPRKEKPAAEKAENIHEKPYYLEVVQPTTREVAKKLGKDVVMGILDEFGSNVATAKDLEEGQWEDYVARLKDELGNAGGDEDDEDLS